jgi:hypothetical protein
VVVCIFSMVWALRLLATAVETLGWSVCSSSSAPSTGQSVHTIGANSETNALISLVCCQSPGRSYTRRNRACVRAMMVLFFVCLSLHTHASGGLYVHTVSRSWVQVSNLRLHTPTLFLVCLSSVFMQSVTVCFDALFSGCSCL